MSLKYDETSPQASPAARPPDANGWYNNAVTITFQGADGTSGVASCTQVTYAGPDDPSVALSGTCLDRAGNQSASSSFTLKYDETAPLASATASRSPDVNGWYNRALTVSFSGSDVTSGLDVCDAPKTYSGPDNAGAAVVGSCRDLAGNVAPRSVPLKYDATAPQVTATPSRSPNAHGWFNAPLTVTYTGTDATSGLSSCDAAKSYSGPDNAAATVAGTCGDQAGNVGSAAFPVKYDATAPIVSATPSRPANANGWYNGALTISFAATDATSLVDSCDAAKNYSGPDTTSKTESGTCRDKAGNSSSASLTFKYDASAPQASATPSRPPNASGWYTAALTVTFAATDATSLVDSCDAAKTYSGPDGASTSVSGTCVDKAGNHGATSYTFKYDASAPQVTATPSRPPNSNGWYNAALTVSFAATDATSLVDSCDAAKTYSTPDTTSTTVAGSCRDKAGNSGSTSFPLKYDATAPVASATPSRPPNANGWYNAALTVSFGGNDATSGPVSCNGDRTYSGPDIASVLISGSCQDRAGNVASPSLAFKYDQTAPLASATPSRPPNANGWYNAALNVTFAATDTTSTVDSCDGAKTYSGPDAVTTAVSGICRDKAGNSGAASVAFKYDATAPTVNAAARRSPDANGWYNAPLTVGFGGSDATAGIVSCDADKTYSGPDSGSASVSGSCIDQAGNTGVRSFVLGYDTTSPQVTGASPAREPDANGWYNAPLALTFQGSDPTSGVHTCTNVTYGGPDTVAASVTGSCRDRAGNQSGSSAFGFKYDGTAPQVTNAVAVRPPDQAGWYNRPVAFAFLGADTTAGIDSCPPGTYEGADSAEASIAGVCVDKAGNRSSRSFPLRYDDTGPDAAASPDRAPDANGWYNRALRVSFSGSDPVSGLQACEPPQSYEGPDSGFAVVGGTCIDKAGNVGLASLPLSYDATAPQVTGATPARPPDSNGWYNHPLAVTFHGSDVTSEIDACTVAGYGGPDAPAAAVTGSCRDRAGNGSVAASFPLRYDSTPPSLTDVKVKPGNRSAFLSWRASPDTSFVEIVRSAGSRAKVTVYRGAGRSFTDTRLANGTRYRYAVSGFDEAHNSAGSEVQARPTAPLVAPAAGARVSVPPRLSWQPVAKATYYNVQLWRKGKIFSAWPARTSLKLKRSWTYAGRRYRLSPGRYRWFVWPGYGRRAARKYGRLVGSSSFVVTR